MVFLCRELKPKSSSSKLRTVIAAVVSVLAVLQSVSVGVPEKNVARRL